MKVPRFAGNVARLENVAAPAHHGLNALVLVMLLACLTSPAVVQAHGSSFAAQHAPSKASPLPGYLLIADKGNNRLVLMDSSFHVKWSFPRPGDVPPGQQFLIPDDAFFTPAYRTIIATEEDYDVVREIDIRSHHVIWEYGKPGVAGSVAGFLSGPDDAYRLPNGLTTLADIRNCRVIFIRHDGKIVRQYGRTGVCGHDPPALLSAPNGDTPLPDGGMLVTEIGGSWIDRIDRNGKLVWSFQSPLSYPSDAQLLPNGHILACDYVYGGRIVEMDTKGRVVSSFGSSFGPNYLSHPSLAIRLPNGLIAVNDDWNHRVMIVDMAKEKIVWSYGVQGLYGSAPGFLFNPDGIDFLPFSAARLFQNPDGSHQNRAALSQTLQLLSYSLQGLLQLFQI